MSKIDEELVTYAAHWLIDHGHSLDGMAHPEGGEARELAALALHLNLFVTTEFPTCQLIADAVTYVHSAGQACTYIGALNRR